MKKIDYMKILRWIVKKLNDASWHDKKDSFVLFEKPYICIMQFCNDNHSLYTLFANDYCPAERAAKKYLHELAWAFSNLRFIVNCNGDEDDAKMTAAWLNEMLHLPIEQLMVKVDLEE